MENNPIQPPPPGAPDALVPATADERNLAVLIHGLSIFSSFLAPLLIWVLKKDDSEFVDYNGKEALNFQITMLIAWTGAFLLVFVIIGLLLLPILALIQIILPIMAAVSASKGEHFVYPLTLRLLK